ncbi:MAG: XRE family transcriptional regulator [Propionibacteriaceae bacterium]|jgi:Zn-dependent peptidase ImmA (M78 family)|nr:XRE family transcriptional regulator [Propionibacteriaceae bacterium]
MTAAVGDALLVLRRAADITQEELAQRLGITQAALSRYENDLREPDDAIARSLASALGVTVGFLRHEFHMRGGVAADAHMRRQKTAKSSDWKRVEARVNQLRMHSTYLLDRAPLRTQNQIIRVDPDERAPEDAARMLRAAWRMPIGPIRHLVKWVESAGIIVVEEDFGTHRIDGMSQWASGHAVIIINSSLATDRKRLTLAHETGHLVLHSDHMDSEVEDQANAFAAEWLMPERVIAPELTNLTLGKLADLKLEWGVSMQALFERAFRLGKASTGERQSFYRQMSHRGWRTREPNSHLIPEETPELAASVGLRLTASGLTEGEVRQLIGVAPGAATPFLPPSRTLRIV